MNRETRLILGSIAGVFIGLFLTVWFVIGTTESLRRVMWALLAGGLLFWIFLDKEHPWMGVKLVSIFSGVWFVFFEVAAIIITILQQRIEALSSASSAGEMGAAGSLMDMLSSFGYIEAFFLALLTLLVPTAVAWYLAKHKKQFSEVRVL